MNAPEKLFVAVSTPASIGKNQISLLALAEIFLACGCFWFVASYSHFYYPLLVSALVAPLLLLRSEQSIRQGVVWFENYRDSILATLTPTATKHPLTRAFGGSIALACAATLASTWLLFSIVGVAGMSMPQAVVVCAAIGYLATQLAFAFVIACCAHEVIAIAERRGWIIFVGVALAASVAVPVGVLSTHWYAYTSAALAPLLSTLYAAHAAEKTLVKGREAAGRQSEKRAQQIAFTRDLRERLATFYAFFIVGCLLGILLRCFAIRFVATLRHFSAGLPNIRENYLRTLFVVDIRTLPELMPGYAGDDPFEATYYLKRLKEKEPISKRIEHVVALLVWYVPAYFYRLSIKSTFWVYGSLLYSFWPRHRGEEPHALRAYLMDSIRRPTFERLTRWFAALTLVTAGTTMCLPQAGLFAMAEYPKMINPVEYLFVLDWGKIAPWAWPNLIGAMLTFAAWWVADKSQIPHKYSQEVSIAARRVRLSNYLMERCLAIRSVATFSYICIVLLHAALGITPLSRYLPYSIVDGLKWFYGARYPVVAASI